MIDMMLAPWRSSLSMTAAALETMLVAQKNMLGVGGFLDKEGLTEDRMRDMFHTSADANMRRWEEINESLKNIPDVYHEMSRVPGTVLTDLFDAARRPLK